MAFLRVFFFFLLYVTIKKLCSPIGNKFNVQNTKKCKGISCFFLMRTPLPHRDLALRCPQPSFWRISPQTRGCLLVPSPRLSTDMGRAAGALATRSAVEIPVYPCLSLFVPVCPPLCPPVPVPPGPQPRSLPASAPRAAPAVCPAPACVTGWLHSHWLRRPRPARRWLSQPLFPVVGGSSPQNGGGGGRRRG